MRSFLRLLPSCSPISSSSSHYNCCFRYSSLLHFSSSSSSSVSFISKNPNPIFIDFLIQTLGFSKPQALSISKRLGSFKFRQKPESVSQLLLEFGLSETQIRRAVLTSPRILSYTVENNLKPKLSLFQKELGLTGSQLGLFISNNPNILTVSLERRLIPNISIIKNIIPKIENDENGERGRLIPRQRCSSFFATDPKKLLSNISFLQSCGIVGDQLSTLLKRDLQFFSKRESVIRGAVLNAQEMGFSCNSSILVYVLSILGSRSSKAVESKFKLLRSFGFSQKECSAMFKTAPLLLTNSEKKLKLGIDFFDGAGFERKMLVNRPTCLMYSLEKRVIPRFKVYQILKSKHQLSKNNNCQSFSNILDLTEKSFMKKFVFKFGDNAEDLLAAYNNGIFFAFIDGTKLRLL